MNILRHLPPFRLKASVCLISTALCHVSMMLYMHESFELETLVAWVIRGIIHRASRPIELSDCKPAGGVSLCLVTSIQIPSKHTPQSNRKIPPQ
jgi:hypothetical protein